MRDSSPPLVEWGLSRTLTEIARELRQNSTEAERNLWFMLCLKNLGVKFRRQAVIGRYIVDFVCFERKLVVEVDGGQHADSEADVARDHWLKNEGFKILRFWNHEVLRNRDEVLQKIIEELISPARTLPTRGREE